MEKGKFIEAWAFATVIFADDSPGHVSCDIKYETYDEVLELIISGQCRGFSPEVTIRNFECSVCHSDYEKCSHEEGHYYSGIACKLIAKNIEFVGCSIVPQPKDPRCRVNDLLVIWEAKKTKAKLFEWHGFELHTENISFRI